ncbi:hypothetical protein QO058_16650 [Bosea vestrisii]|uniref:hypothetical protein n=1 Tax=Bosea vestrisii TaxID=151416 RepID=UPI0024DFF0E2|nr:hypothetical protein [Bosea vestrisii]WID94475.1 hypothetical protein QO058_16650 [Bosea vestrisii]
MDETDMHSVPIGESSNFRVLTLHGLPEAIAHPENILWSGRFLGEIDNVFSVSLQ